MTTEEVKVAEFELPEGFNPNVCDVCGGLSGGEHVGVAAIPGVPMSISWCRECLNHSATPEWNVRTEFAFVGGEFASWFLEQELWAYSEGRYRSVREWIAENRAELEVEAAAFMAEYTDIMEREEEVEIREALAEDVEADTMPEPGIKLPWRYEDFNLVAQNDAGEWRSIALFPSREQFGDLPQDIIEQIEAVSNANGAYIVQAVTDHRDLTHLFELEHRRMVQAIAHWRAESPVERDLISPDLGRLLDWLMNKAGLAVTHAS